MPEYVFDCTNPDCAGEDGVATRFSLTQSMAEEHVGSCPKCASDGRRVFLPVGASFKGPGFHCNDYPRG